MTTDKQHPRIVVAENLYRDNDIYVFTTDMNTETELCISGVSFAMPLAPKDWHKIGLNKELFSQLDKVVAEYFETVTATIFRKQLFVYLQTFWQRPDRISDHLKLWGYLKTKLQLDLTGLELISEVALSRDEETCYAGIIRIEPGYFQSIMKTLRSNQGFALLSNGNEMNYKQNLAELSGIAYSPDDSIYWQKIAECICPLGDIVIRVPTILDIPPNAYESAIDLFLLPNHLKQLMNSVAELENLLA